MDLMFLEFQGSRVKDSHRSRDCDGRETDYVATGNPMDDREGESGFVIPLSQDTWLQVFLSKAATGNG